MSNSMERLFENAVKLLTEDKYDEAIKCMDNALEIDPAFFSKIEDSNNQ